MSDSATLLCSDQCRRWLDGDRVMVEAYLEQRPGLEHNAEAVLDLIYNEIVLREKAGETPRLDDYLIRFPQFDCELRAQFKVHNAIEDALRSSCENTGTGTETGSAPISSQAFRDTSSVANGGVAESPLDAVPLFAGYEILGEIGRGGMGIVYRARQLGLKRLVALKVIRAGAYASPMEEARFRTEAEAVARLRHPHIVQIYEIGEQAGLPYLALELVDGPSLDEVIAEQQLSPCDAAALVESLARAMHEVHRQGIVHRDLKPANVLLSYSPGLRGSRGDALSTGLQLNDWTAKITDFGLAKLLNDDGAAGQTRTVVGTPNYMAPEQAAGQGAPISPLADVYGLGAILYELLTRQPPFHGKTVLEVLEKLRHEEPAPPSHFRQDLSRDLETICLKCLEKDPGRRYGSALNLAEDLRRFLAHEPIQARPTGLGEQALKWVKRHPARAGLLAVATAAAAFLVLLEVRHNLVLQDREDEARVEERREQLDRLQEARATYHTFVRRRGEALFQGIYGTLFPGGDAAKNQPETRRAIEKALAVAGIDGVSKSPPILNPYWSAREKAEVSAGCYQLLLVLADTTASSLAPRPDEARRQRVLQAIDILDRAANVFPPTQAYHLRRARYLAELGHEADARRERDLASRIPPTGLIDYLLLGDERYQRGEFELAAQAFQKALLLEPADFWSQYFLAICQLKLKSPAEAQAGLTKCLTQRPDFHWARLLRGLAHGELNDFDAAERDFRAVLQSNANADVRHIVYVSRGLLRFRRKQVDEAIADFREAIALKPDQFHASLTLAKLYQAQNKLDESNEQLARALRLRPPAATAAQCHTEQSRNLYLAKQYRAALTAAESAVKIFPSYADGHRGRALALLKLRSFKEAVRSFDRYLANGGKPGADFYRARGQAKAQLRDYLGAKDDYTRALQVEPGSELFGHRGWAYYFADAWKPAWHDFDEAIRLDPSNGDAFTGRGLAGVMLGRFRAAVADAEEALHLRPRTPEMMHNLACIFALAGAEAAKTANDNDHRALAAGYRERAFEMICKTLAMIPRDERRAFWREKILPEAALASIHNDPAFARLDPASGYSGK